MMDELSRSTICYLGPPWDRNRTGVSVLGRKTLSGRRPRGWLARYGVLEIHCRTVWSAEIDARKTSFSVYDATTIERIPKPYSFEVCRLGAIPWSMLRVRGLTTSLAKSEGQRCVMTLRGGEWPMHKTLLIKYCSVKSNASHLVLQHKPTQCLTPSKICQWRAQELRPILRMRPWAGPYSSFAIEVFHKEQPLPILPMVFHWHPRATVSELAKKICWIFSMKYWQW